MNPYFYPYQIYPMDPNYPIIEKIKELEAKIKQLEAQIQKEENNYLKKSDTYNMI